MVGGKHDEAWNTRQLVRVKIAREQIRAVIGQGQINFTSPQRGNHLAGRLIEHFHFNFRMRATQRGQRRAEIFLHCRGNVANAHRAFAGTGDSVSALAGP